MSTARIRLRFPEDAMERMFVRENDRKNRIFNRIGIYLSTVGWAIFVVGSRGTYDSNVVSRVTGNLSLILGPLFVVIIAVTFVDRLLPWCQPLTAFANLLAALIGVYFATVFVYEPGALAQGIVMFVFYALFILRVRFRLAVSVTFAYVALTQWTFASSESVSPGLVQMLSSNIWSAWLCAAIGGYFFERSERRAFAQSLIIEQQQQQIIKEQERSEWLLLNILPPEIAARLKNDETTIEDKFDSVTVLFADIVGFTTIGDATWLSRASQLVYT